MSKSNPYAPKSLESTPSKPHKAPQKPRESLVDGTIKEVLARVGDDPQKAQEALNAEQAKDSPRSTLVKTLTDLSETDGDN